MNNTVIHTKYGCVQGRHIDGCTEYLGIPFAKPPVGELTFRHPEPPEPWDGVLSAVKGRENPMQDQANFGTGNNSLDCLYLNIFVPDGLTGPTPVMVWIYGGAWSNGGNGAKEKDSDEIEYDLSYFAKETATIVVTVNYRLNLYGFLYLRFISEAFDTNNGLYDQIMALRFVHDNIAAFGGDPNNVTAFGQSAGAASILALMTMPEADGLFQKCIVQSSCTEHFFREKDARTDTLKYLKYAGIDKNHPEELLRLSPEQVVKANAKYGIHRFMKGDIRCAFSPIIDGITLKEEPKLAVMKSRRPMMIGNNENELAMGKTGKLMAFMAPLVTRFFHFKVEKGMEPYAQRANDAMADHIYKRPLREILQGYEGAAWRYEYRYVSKQAKDAGFGCFHGSELGVMFYNRTVKQETEDPETVQAGNELRHIWSRFARTGNPGWERWQISHHTQVVP